MLIAQATQIHNLLVQDKWIDGANEILGLAGQVHKVKSRNEALAVARGLFSYLLDSDDYLTAAALQWGEDFITDAESTKRVFNAMHLSSKVLFMGASSMGKCLGPDVEVLMFDGTVRKAKDVKAGELLMGDDSRARTVLATNYGVGPMYKITPERGNQWTCNDKHILSLRISADKICGNSHKPSKKTFKGAVVDMPIETYLSRGRSRKNILKQFHVGVDFPGQLVPYDPYIYGSWIGDGGTDVPSLHTPDGPMAQRWCEYFLSLGMRIHVGYADQNCKMWCARPSEKRVIGRTNPFLDFIRTSVIAEKKEKFIRQDYLINSRHNRLKLLAGLIDSDGWVASKTSYHFCTKFPALAKQVMWLARSLGFAAVVRTKICKIASIGFSAPYDIVQISGHGITEIPTLEKRAREPSTNKNLSNTGFRVEPIGTGEYFGFLVDGNSRFLLGDFTVTHNSYNAGIWCLLDYLRDPLYTSIKLSSVNEDQLRKQLFAHLANRYRSCIIPSPYNIIIRDSDMWMGIKEAGNEFGVTGIAFKQSQETSGQLKGYKSQPVRIKAHPKFGKMSRLRILGDEGQNWPGGPFQDFNSLIASVSGADLVKIAVAFNPEDTSRHVVQMAEPPDGWDPDDIERLYDYEAKSGWRVCRLDASLCENVKQRKIVYPGLQTYEGFMGYLKAGGDSSAAYSCFARGWPPMKGSIWTVIPPTWPQEARGEAIFIETPRSCAAVDLAFMGQDTAQMVVGRWGVASGYRDIQGQTRKFMDRTNVAKEKPRHVLQIDQILPLQKSDNTVAMSEEIVGRCRMLKIEPEWVAIDATGYGFGVAGHLKKVFGDVFSISWNEKATERKFLAEEEEGADAQVEGVMSEMWWALRRWIDPNCKAVLINPIIPTNPIHTQLTARRYRNGKNGIKVESKDEYKGRNKNSPDEADSFVMLVHLIRKMADVLPGLVEAPVKKRQKDDGERMNWMSVGKMEQTDLPDSLEDEKSQSPHNAIVLE